MAGGTVQSSADTVADVRAGRLAMARLPRAPFALMLALLPAAATIIGSSGDPATGGVVVGEAPGRRLAAWCSIGSR